MTIITALIAETRTTFLVAIAGFLSFLRRPTPHQPWDAALASRTALAFSLLILSFLVTAIFGLIALPIIVSTKPMMGESLKNVFDQSALSVIVSVVILGPLIEEMMFRGWLSGTVRTLMGTALFIGTIYGGAWFLKNFVPSVSGIQAQIGLAIIGLSIFFALQRKSGEYPPSWFKSVFPAIFWLQGIIFGGLHFANMSSSSILLPVLMTLPLIVCGWIWGYARVSLGFVAAWTLHMAYNIPAALAATTIIAAIMS